MPNIARSFALVLAILLPALAHAQPAPCNGAPCITAISQTGGYGDGFVTVTIKNAKLPDLASYRLILNDFKFAAVPDIRAPDTLKFHVADLAADQSGTTWPKVICPIPITGIESLTVAIAGPDGTDIATQTPVTLTLPLYNAGRLGLGVIAAIAFAIAVTSFAHKTGMLRNPPDKPSPQPATIPPIQPVATTPATLPLPDNQRPWSLGRCQMAFWTLLIFTLFIILWAVTGTYNGIITDGSLTLMGISATAGVSAAAIDNARPAYFSFGQSDGFFKDILKDANGWSFARLQNVAWTLVLGYITIHTASNTLKLPNFDPDLLILMGISSGVYLGFKYPEPSS